ncbi:Metallo-dependent phosphatase-like protein [Hypoxylon argillaceum]|nr:Metallo-dependent phosphatase-like protein [Hypoxylon argillaceum]
MPSIKTRFLVLSDTHGCKFPLEKHPQLCADVAIHCGDLTEESKIAEFRISLELLKNINAPLKLVIAGNHDFTLDPPVFKKKIDEARPVLQPEEVAKEYGAFGEARTLFQDAKDSGIVFLDEGTHRFILQNGAALTVYASPYTPSLSDWGFQYHPEKGHEFSIETDADVAITHGPPRGIMDLTDSGRRAGCTDLFAAVARNRPALHCFGHIHEGWGAKLVTWREKTSEPPSHFADIDNGKSIVIENLRKLRRSTFDDEEEAQLKARKAESYAREGCCRTSHCAQDQHQLQRGRQTLCINAALEDTEEQSMHLPWLVDVELYGACDVLPKMESSSVS